MAGFVWVEFAIGDAHVTVSKIRLLSRMKINSNVYGSFDTIEKKIS